MMGDPRKTEYLTVFVYDRINGMQPHVSAGEFDIAHKLTQYPNGGIINLGPQHASIRNG
jgi:hypothetical protein